MTKSKTQWLDILYTPLSDFEGVPLKFALKECRSQYGYCNFYALELKNILLELVDDVYSRDESQDVTLTMSDILFYSNILDRMVKRRYEAWDIQNTIESRVDDTLKKAIELGS